MFHNSLRCCPKIPLLSIISFITEVLYINQTVFKFRRSPDTLHFPDLPRTITNLPILYLFHQLPCLTIPRIIRIAKLYRKCTDYCTASLSTDIYCSSAGQSPTTLPTTSLLYWSRYVDAIVTWHTELQFRVVIF